LTSPATGQAAADARTDLPWGVSRLTVAVPCWVGQKPGPWPARQCHADELGGLSR